MKKVIYLLACVAFLGCYSCSDDDDGLKMQDISVEFAVMTGPKNMPIWYMSI